MPKVIELLKRMMEAKTPEQRKALEPEMAAFLVEQRDNLPEDSSARHLINFHFAGQALLDALVKEKRIMSAQALASFVPQFVKVCAIDRWLSEKDDSDS